ncbi:Protein of unknown function [Bacillus mycoides]|nr:Protein of unknown function [Bacillus mycoides]
MTLVTKINSVEIPTRKG